MFIWTSNPAATFGNDPETSHSPSLHCIISSNNEMQIMHIFNLAARKTHSLKLYCLLSLPQMFPRSPSPPLRRNSQRPWSTTLWWKVSFKETQIRAPYPETTRRAALAGLPVHSSLKRYWRHFAKPIAKAGMWWWVSPTPAASGAAARVRSALSAEGQHMQSEAYCIH